MCLYDESMALWGIKVYHMLAENRFMRNSGVHPTRKQLPICQSYMKFLETCTEVGNTCKHYDVGTSFILIDI